VKRDQHIEDLRLWAIVASTVRPLQGRALPAAPPSPPKPTKAETKAAPPAKAPPPASKRSPAPPQDVEPGYRRRLIRGRESVAARIDLHGLGQDAARAALTRFIERSASEGWRAVLVITGKGTTGDGVLKRRVPDWLAEPPIRQHIAGVSEAHRRHGGEGALYVALRRGSAELRSM
jgi:DNA-nicking Smr family endonuclease